MPASVALGLLVGLVVGSFLNVLIHRLPRMMQDQWVREAAEWQALQGDSRVPQPSAAPRPAPYNLVVPRSACPACGHVLAWHENIPVLSYLLLRGRCSACAQRISWRYPAVELATAALFAACLWRFGLSPTGWMWCGVSAVWLALALIDWDTQYLPDDLTLPLLWAGLVAAALGLNPWAGWPQAFWGAVGGYLSLWLVYQGFKLATGKEGMGHGDFKLLAALGAWLGWPALLLVVLLASLSGAFLGLGLRALGRMQVHQPMPFGPFLVLAAYVALWLGPERWWPVF
jgi:leader peptidase (prepilin peptidase)/N-methyltransferase